MSKKLILIFLLLLSVHVYSSDEGIKPEIGFWLGASNPLYGTPTAKYLQTTLSAGGFFRFQWPFNLFLTEIGTSFSNYQSTTERGLTIIPAYMALVYKLPFELPMSILLKAGGGGAYVVARPANTFRYDPLGFLGTEFSFVAGKKVRIGLRIDYNHVFESHLRKKPAGERFYASPYEDPRIQNPQNYKFMDTQFFHFGLMVSFLL